MDSKILIMCEGANEKCVVEMLLNNQKMIYDDYDLIGLGPFHAR